MTGPRVLSIGTYPIRAARHGGPRRAAALLAAYRAAGLDARYLAVYSRWASAASAPGDLAVGPPTDRLIRAERDLEDVFCGRAVADDPAVRDRVGAALDALRPEVLQVEQIYPWLGLAEIVDRLEHRPRLVYSAHNVEATMKAETYARTGLRTARAVEVVGEIRRAEADLAARADLVVAVTDADAAAFGRAGARRVVVAGNGADPPTPEPRAEARWRRRFRRRGAEQTLTFVSSAHLPNWYGFLDMVGLGLAFLPATARVVLAGSLSELVRARLGEPGTVAEVAFARRSILTGRLGDAELAGLLAVSDVLLLPIVGGGGSNLKTAEALLSGRPIVGTSFAFRSYEGFVTAPGVRIADSPAEFRAAMLAALASPFPAGPSRKNQLPTNPFLKGQFPAVPVPAVPVPAEPAVGGPGVSGPSAADPAELTWVRRLDPAVRAVRALTDPDSPE